MSNTKLQFSAALIIASFGLTACGGNDDPAPGNPVPPPQAAESFPTTATQSIDSLFAFAQSSLEAPSDDEPLSLQSIVLPVDDESDSAPLR